jgi:hypothetical protein
MDESGDTFTSTGTTTVSATLPLQCEPVVIDKTDVTVALMSVSIVLILLVGIKLFKTLRDQKTKPKPYETFVSTLAADNGWAPAEIGDDDEEETDVVSSGNRVSLRS